MYLMRNNPLHALLRQARRRKGLSQAALAAASGTGRITIARLEAGGAGDFRVGTLARLCDALDLELAAAPRGPRPSQEALLAREHERIRRLDLRRRHAALAARLLAAPPAQATALLRNARAAVDRWERERLCSDHYISRWRDLLAGPARRAALRLLEHDGWTDALFQNTPWSAALEPAAA
jgi:HTH-type transcriptional regulator / antitoxin HipB